MDLHVILERYPFFLIGVWSLLIFGICAALAIWLTKSISPIEKDLEAVAEILERYLAAEKHLTQNDVEDMSEELMDRTFFKERWKEFKETLVPVKGKDGSEFVYNTRRAGEFINAESLIEHRVNLYLFQAIPGVLTGLGLIGTFSAIFFALLSLHANEHTQQVEGINEFINSLSFKFVSSIVGLITAIGFLMFEKFKIGSVSRLCLRIEQLLDRLFPQRVTEDILDKMLKHIEEQTTNFSHLSSDLAGHLKDGFKESVVPVMERMVKAIDDLLVAADHLQKQKEESTGELIERMVSNFQSSLTEHAGDEFKQLAAALDVTAGFVKDMNIKMEESLDHSQALLLEQQRQSAAHLETINKTIESMMTNINDGITTQHETMRRYILEMQQLFSDSSKDLERSNRTFVDTVQATVSEMVEKNKEWSGSIADAGVMVKAAAGELESTFRAQKSFLEEVSSVGNALRQASEVLSSSTDNLSTLNKLSEDGLQKIIEQVTRADDVMKELQSLLNRQESVYATMDSSVAQVLSSVNIAMREYSEHTRESLGTYLSMFDKHLADAAGHLQGTVTELAEHLGDLGDVIEKKLTTVSVPELPTVETSATATT